MAETDPVPTITGFGNVPAFAKGMVRDLRIRWALEEVGRPYRMDLLDAMAPRPEGYRAWQPFGQVPAFDDGQVRMFETGAILLYLAEREERLLPADPQTRWQAVSWLIAALNSVEPALTQVVILDFFQKGKDWTAGAREGAAFVEAHIIRVTEKAFVDFAAGGADRAANRRMLGLER